MILVIMQKHALELANRARIMPELKFVVDNSLMEGMRISNLVDTIIREDNAKHVNEDDSSVDDASNSDDKIKQADDKDS